MTEFSSMHGYNGAGKFCSECKRECTYIQVSSVYYECLGAHSCGQVLCDHCQQVKVLEFENKPYLALARNSLEANYNGLLSDLIKLQASKANFDEAGNQEEEKHAENDGGTASGGGGLTNFLGIQKRLFNFFSRNVLTSNPGGPTPGGPEDGLDTPGGPDDEMTPGGPPELDAAASSHAAVQHVEDMDTPGGPNDPEDKQEVQV